MYFNITCSFSVEPLSSETNIQGIASNEAHDSAIQGGAKVASPAPKLAEGHSAKQQEVIDYAWEVSDGDMRFIYLLTAENGEYSHRRVHPKVAGSTGTDHGLCGTNDYHHSDIVRNPLFLEDWKWQMRECYKLYQEGTTFYGIIRYDNDPSYRQKIHNKFQ